MISRRSLLTLLGLAPVAAAAKPVESDAPQTLMVQLPPKPIREFRLDDDPLGDLDRYYQGHMDRAMRSMMDALQYAQDPLVRDAARLPVLKHARHEA